MFGSDDDVAGEATISLATRNKGGMMSAAFVIPARQLLFLN
jgi:hypothetical protein